MPDYSKTVLYKIVCKDINITDCYIGHTTNIINRIYRHKYNCNNEKDIRYNLKVYQFIRTNGGWINWTLIKIEDYPCNDIYEALKRENYWLKQLKSSLNSDIPGRNKKEYHQDNKELILEYKKEYREKNKKIITEKAKENITCECGCIIRKCCLTRHLKTQKHKEYINKNKEEIYDKRNEKITCECGCKISKRNISAHRKTQKHLSLLKLEDGSN